MKHNAFNRLSATVLSTQRLANPTLWLGNEDCLHHLASALDTAVETGVPDLEPKLARLGLTAETARACLIIPVVSIAASDGSIDLPERAATQRLEFICGLEDDQRTSDLVDSWLRHGISASDLELALEIIGSTASSLPRHLRRQQIDAFARACRTVAIASVRGLAGLVGLVTGITPARAAALNNVLSKLEALAGCKNECDMERTATAQMTRR